MRSFEGKTYLNESVNIILYTREQLFSFDPTSESSLYFYGHVRIKLMFESQWTGFFSVRFENEEEFDKCISLFEEDDSLHSSPNTNYEEIIRNEITVIFPNYLAEEFYSYVKDSENEFSAEYVVFNCDMGMCDENQDYRFTDIYHCLTCFQEKHQIVNYCSDCYNKIDRCYDKNGCKYSHNIKYGNDTEVLELYRNLINRGE